ncbi:MAG: hypothetical protein M0D55_02340 [Elusimicrobiota bacterium]|nr:MAG: hypothetical protein M0D55_02340 [Elusimicrobiota bacterium]
MTNKLALAVLLLAAPAGAEDWLDGAAKSAREAVIPGVPAPEPAKKGWIPFIPNSRLFSGEIPAEGWWPMEEETATGSVFRLLGADSQSGSVRATMSVRFYDKDTPGFTPIKQAVEIMRKEDKTFPREITPVRPVRVGLGLARTFEIVETRRMPSEDGPAFEEELHHYVAVIPVGEAYYLIRLISSRATYLDYRDDFVRFMKSMRTLSR